MSTKAKVAFVCSDCGNEHAKWQGKCGSCGAWNTLQEFSLGKNAAPRAIGYSGTAAEVTRLDAIKDEAATRTETGIGELDRVLGGGFVAGSVVLIGGDPGAGKSTLLLEVSAALARESSVLYVSGEESLQQIAARARRMELDAGNVAVVSETSVENIEAIALAEQPRLMVVDSIQVMHTESSDSLPGSVTQVRDAAARLTRLAKQSGTTIVLVGHVTKEGNLAGPKVLEHMIDCFLMLDAPPGSRFRTLRGMKNRFGAVNELGVFAMTDRGLKEVTNPSAIFLQRGKELSPGSVVTVTWEGTRPLLVEIQALVDDVQGSYPKRVALGLDAQRLAMHLAVLHRHCGIALSDQDVFANVVGGVRIAETGADLAVLAAVLSSFQNRTVPKDLVVFGELGLTGELRPVVNGIERIREAQKHGFTRAIVPRANRPREPIAGIETHAVGTLNQAIDALAEISRR